MRVLKILLILLFLNGSLVYAQNEPPARVVTSKIVFQNVAHNRSFIGTLYYERISHLSSEVTGLVTKINVRTGDKVNQDSSLIYLDRQILEKEILIHKTRIEQEKLNINHMQKKYHRVESLFKKGTISENDYDDAEFALKEALLKEKSAGTILEKLLIQKSQKVIKAPFDGIILEKNVDSGDWVQPGKVLLRIGSVNDLFIKVPVAETMLKFISQGQKVPVIITAYNKKMVGTIENLSPEADAKTKNIFLKIRIPMLNRVAENMSATVFIPTSTEKKLAMISRDALVDFQGKDFVYTIKEKKAVMLPINIVTYLDNMVGADNEHFVQGMPIVVEGNERLQPGQAVVTAGD